MKDHVAIVGAGPAGAWAAYCLARRGARVALFDPSHPREKPCGGGVTGRALALVAGAIDASVLPASIIRSARFVDTASERSASIPLDTSGLDAETMLAVVSRSEFDRALLDAACHAGATLVPARVTDVAVTSHGVRLETTAGPRQASFVIGADGANSLVKRRLARPFRRDQLSIATGYFAHGVTGDEIVIELTADPPGYIWSFPRPTHLAIGICAQADAGATAGALRDRTAAWIRQVGIARGARLAPYSWPIPSLDAAGFGTLEIAGSRWCLAGDAAGLVDPITREGIYFALVSGMWAAECVDARGPDAYASRVREEIVPELTRAAQWKSTFFRPAFTALLMRALQQSAAIGEVIADLVAGRQSYRGLERRLLQTVELGLAWQLLVSARSIRRAL